MMIQPLIKLLGLSLAMGLSTLPEVALAFDPSKVPLPGLSQPSAYLPPLVEPLRLEISLNKKQVTLFEGEKVVKTYPIAIGRAGWETPEGNFKVAQMVKDPTWQNPLNGYIIPSKDPENPLGRYWIGFWTDGKNWVGLHETPNIASVGTAASHGCIRMYGKDIAEIFAKVKLGTPVTVVR